MQRNGALLLAGVVEAHPLGGAGLVRPDHEVVAVAVGGEVAVDDLGHEHVGGLGLGQLLAQDRADAVLELVVGLVAVGAFSGRNCHWLRNSAVSLM